MNLILSIAVMAGTTYLIRMIPFTLVRKKIRSPYLQSLLFYLPYAVLSAMTIPAIFYSTGNLPSAILGTAVAAIMAFSEKPLIVVALSAALSSFVLDLLI